MAIMKEDDALRVEPSTTAAFTEGGDAITGDEVDVLGTTDVQSRSGKTSWTKVRLFVSDKTPEGWVRSSRVDLEGVVPGGPIDKFRFANQCWVEAIFSDANPHYVAAVAEMRSGTSTGQAAGPPDPLFGPFRFTQAEWDAARAKKEFGVPSYSARDIADWRMQVVLFTLMTHRTEAQLVAELEAAGRRPSAAELYLAQIIGAKAAAAALTTDPRPTIKKAFDGVPAADQAEDRPLGAANFDKIVARYPEMLDTGLIKGEDAIDRIVARLDPVLTTTRPTLIRAGAAMRGVRPEDGTVSGAGHPFPDFDSTAGNPFDQKAPFIMRRLLDDFSPKFKDFHAAAILGNIGHETGGMTLMQEVRPRAGRGGLGWLQWTGPRRLKFEAFCAPPKPSTATDEGNYTFMVHEMQGEEAQARKLFEVTTNLDDATRVFMKEYERPGVEALEKRKQYARRALSLFHSPGASLETRADGAIVQKLQSLIDARQIIFDKTSLKDELLGVNDGNTKVTPKLQALVIKISELADPHPIRISSLLRADGNSHHTEGRAVDIGNQEIATTLLPRIATDDRVRSLGIDELIFNAGFPHPQKFNYDEGVRHEFNQATLDQHGNHIHFAVIA